MLYEYTPRYFGIDILVVAPSRDMAAWLQHRENMTKLVQLHLTQAQQCMKSQANKKCSDRNFVVGDSVYMKLRPYVQSSVANRSNMKLSFRFFGPYEVVEKIGSIAYALWLPDDSRVHPVCHVSQC